MKQKRFGAFVVHSDGTRNLAEIEGIPLVFATWETACEWAEDNYPAHFDNFPNGWKSYEMQIGEIL